eukprot:CAMPEP_0194402592 /NCGR_PEP_ID=MMETSP0176-20130528/1278_1 /TAXON_ID=216777 /ORGANISM="Proboscia alata, Strain PI-D3" /LENGTH=638 /DNA_ID=CAMNT_0039200009 /DNA_START=36 /DNA_END=1952 /DNA_ORIENTATION=+
MEIVDEEGGATQVTDDKTPLNESNNGATDDDFDPDDTDDKTKSRYNLPVGDVTCCLPKHGLISSPLDVITMTWAWLLLNKTQILSGVTVALAQIPEAVSFSFVAGVDPIVGLQSAWIMGICTSLAGGRPGMVAGSTGAVAVVLTGLVADFGPGHMFYAIMLAGILQMIFGLLRLGVLVKMIPHPVMVGFCNGLGVVIGLAQFNIFKVAGTGDNNHDRRLSEIGGAFLPFTNGTDWCDATMGLWMAFHIGVTLLTYVMFPKITKAIPASLAGIIMSTVVEWAFVRQIGYETNTVADLASVAGAFPSPVWFDTRYGYKDMMPPLTLKTFGEVLPTAITAGAIGLLESLLTLQLIDELTNTKGNGNREAFGQGLGQFLSGAFGGMGGCTTIGQSLMNIHSGGSTRLSSSVAATFMLLIILVAYPLINLIPVASLAGVMFIVTYFTIEWGSFKIVLAALLPEKVREKRGIYTKVKRSDCIIMLIVVAVTLIFDLAIAVAVGIVCAALVFTWDSTSLIKMERAVSPEGDKVFYTISGALFFGSVKPLMSLFPDPRSEPKDVTVIFENSEIHDWSGMVAIKALHERFENNGATSIVFEKLSVSSHKLMMKSKQLWEGINYYHEEKMDVAADPEITSHMHVESRR